MGLGGTRTSFSSSVFFFFFFTTFDGCASFCPSHSACNACVTVLSAASNMSGSWPKTTNPFPSHTLHRSASIHCYTGLHQLWQLCSTGFRFVDWPMVARFQMDDIVNPQHPVRLRACCCSTITTALVKSSGHQDERLRRSTPLHQHDPPTKTHSRPCKLDCAFKSKTSVGSAP